MEQKETHSQKENIIKKLNVIENMRVNHHNIELIKKPGMILFKIFFK